MTFQVVVVIPVKVVVDIDGGARKTAAGMNRLARTLALDAAKKVIDHDTMYQLEDAGEVVKIEIGDATAVV